MATYNKKTVEDVDVKGKRVLVRCDFNVPQKDGVITSDKRIVEALPTIKYLMGQGAKVILCSHMGKPKGEVNPKYSLSAVAVRLSELLGVKRNTTIPSSRNSPRLPTCTFPTPSAPCTARTPRPPAWRSTCPPSAAT